MNLNFLPDTEMGNLIRTNDWSKTTLGHISTWPEGLITALGIMLNSRFPMFLFWGPELISLYNDAYRPSFGNNGMHPKILGLPAEEAWADIWHVVKRFPEQVLKTGVATWEENQLIPIYRNGKTEDVYWTFSHSPIYNTAGSIDGIFVLCMETTQEVLAAKKIKESEERFRTMAENSSALIALGDETSDAVYFNKAWSELTGRNMDDLLKVGWVDLVHAKDKERFLSEYLLAFQKREAFSSEFRMLNRHGKYSWLLINAGPRYYSDGAFAGYVSSAIDFTVQKRQQQKEKKSTRQLSALFAQSPVAMCILRGKDYVVEMSNIKNLELWGRQPEDVMNKPIFDAMPEGKGQGFELLLSRVYDNGETVAVQEMPVSLLRNGKMETIFVNFTTEPLRERDNSISGIISTAVDVTEQVLARKKIEESEIRFRQLIEAAPIAIGLYIGRDLIIENPNQEFIDIVGKGHNIAGKRLTDVMPELTEHGQPYLRILDEVFTSGKPYHSHGDPVSIVRNGEIQHGFYNIYYVPLFDTTGKVYAILDITSDVTESVQNKKRIEESESRFRLALTGSNQVVFSQDINLKHTWIYNPHSDFKTEDIIGKSDEELHVPSTAKVLTDIKKNVLSTGKSFDGDVEIEIGGQLLTYTLHIEPIKDGPSTVTGITGTVIDITEKVKTQQKIRESEEKFSALADNMENLAWIADGDGWIYWYNKRWYDYTGTTLEEMQGWGWQKVHHPDYIEAILESSKKIWATNETFELTFPLRRYDGEYRWFLTRGRPITNSEGKIVRWFGTNTDVTEQRETQQLLEYRKALLEAHNESSVDGLLLVDAKGKILSHNKRFIELWNIPQQIVDTQDDDAALTFAMNQLVNPKQFIEKVKFLYEHPKETSTDLLEFKDGKIIERHGYPVVSKEGTYYAWSWTFRDITQQQLADKQIRESEEKFRLLADSMPQFIWTGNERGELNYFNQAVYHYSGLSKEEIEKNGWLQIVHPDEREDNVKQWLLSIKTGKIFNFEHRFRRHDGEYRWQLSRAVPQRDESGRIQMWVGTSTEIQEQKEQREELEKLVQERTAELIIKNKDLEKINKELESFTYIASHDLQEPLRKIQTISTRIVQKETQNLTDTGRDYFQRMQNAASRMQRLIEDLLVFSRTSTGERKFELIPLNTIVEEVTRELHESINENQVIIETTQLCQLRVIQFQFRQLLFNLISNSIKFVNPGTIPHIQIASTIIRPRNAGENIAKLPPAILSTEKQYCCITVKDNGIGFDPRYSDRIFEVFQRLHGKDEYLGTGIGLAIVKKIVDNHDGFITATGEVGKGAVFNIYIPTS